MMCIVTCCITFWPRNSVARFACHHHHHHHQNLLWRRSAGAQ